MLHSPAKKAFRAALIFCLLAHVVAGILTLFFIQPILSQHGIEAMMRLHEHATGWQWTWLIWFAGPPALGAVFFLWAQVLQEQQQCVLARTGALIACIGVPLDLAGIVLHLIALPEISAYWFSNPETVSQPFLEIVFEWVARGAFFLSMFAANLLYCVGGLLISRAAQSHPAVPPRLAFSGYLLWSVGFLLSVFVYLDLTQLILATSAVVLVLMTWWMGAWIVFLGLKDDEHRPCRDDKKFAV